MWNPRAHIEYDLLNIIHEAPNGYKPDFLIDNSYDGFDLLPLLQELPDDDIDVHAIAIATSNPEPTDIDHNWVEKDDTEEDISNPANSTDTDTESKPPSRRWLQRASEIGFRKGSELFMGSAATATIASVPPVSGSNFSNKEKKIPSTTSDEMKNKNSNNRSRKNMIRNRKLQEDGNGNDTIVTVSNATAAAAATTTTASTTKKTYGENDIVPGRGWIVSTHKYKQTHT
jgi:hypothetical protein